MLDHLLKWQLPKLAFLENSHHKCWPRPQLKPRPSSCTFAQTLTWPIAGSFPHLQCLLLKKCHLNSHSSVLLFIPTTAGISNNGKSRAVTEHCCMPLHDLLILQRKMHHLWLSCTFRLRGLFGFTFEKQNVH